MFSLQTVILIIAIVIAIILSIYFIIELIEIPPPTNTSFADLTHVRIRAVANDKYLQLIPCTGAFSPCNNLTCQFVRSGRNLNAYRALTATAETADEAQVFTLCQLTQLTQTKDSSGFFSDNAVYMFFSGTDPHSSVDAIDIVPTDLGIQVLVGRTATGAHPGTCYTWKNLGVGCFCGETHGNCRLEGTTLVSRNNFLFQLTLSEQVQSNVNTNTIPIGIYFINSACTRTEFLRCTGTSTEDNCPPFVTLGGRPTPEDLVSFGFAIEPVA